MPVDQKQFHLETGLTGFGGFQNGSCIGETGLTGFLKRKERRFVSVVY
jgi:hypothetical protein